VHAGTRRSLSVPENEWLTFSPRPQRQNQFTGSPASFTPALSILVTRVVHGIMPCRYAGRNGPRVELLTKMKYLYSYPEVGVVTPGCQISYMDDGPYWLSLIRVSAAKSREKCQPYPDLRAAFRPSPLSSSVTDASPDWKRRSASAWPQNSKPALSLLSTWTFGRCSGSSTHEKGWHSRVSLD
jgi:hypothetical protein